VQTATVYGIQNGMTEQRLLLLLLQLFLFDKFQKYWY